MLALPPWAVRRLAVQPGALVYVHRHRAGELVLSGKALRSAGQPGRRDLEEELAAALAEAAEWKRQALGQEHGDYRSGFTAGYEECLRLGPTWRAAIDGLHEDHRVLHALLLAVPGVRRRARPALPPADASPPPGPPPPSTASGGDAASGGEATQAAH